MKKNLMAIASLLVAAMLLMVSCAQEVKAPENNGLIEAKLSVGYGRGLGVTGDTKTDNIALTYTMSHQWTDSNTAETVVGDKTQETYFTDGGNIGYVTPGLWTVNVFAYAKDESGKATGNAIFEGTANAYISSQNSSVTVYLAPTSSQTNTLKFNITMQDLVGSDVAAENKGDGSFKIVYSVYDTTGSTAIKDKVELTEKTPSDTNNDGKNDTTTYKGSTTLTSGFYRVNVAIYSVTKNESNEDVETPVGGITKGFLLSGGKEATISGHIEPSDYENVSIDAVYVNVKTSLGVEGAAKVDGKDYYSVKYVNGSDAKVTVTMTYNTQNANGLTKTVTTFWSVDGSERNGENDQVANYNKKEFTFSEPGIKNITCTTVYDVTGHEVNEEGETVVAHYYFADSQTITVLVDPTEYNDSLNSAK